jgi:two-component system sensor histidine kinase TctE
VFERFYRLPGTLASGSGLGLSIAQRIADLHHLRLSLDDGPEGRGTRVTVRFDTEPAAVAS